MTFLIISNIFLKTTDERKASTRCFKNKKGVFNNRNITSFKEQLPLLRWRHIDFNGTVNNTYDAFPRTLTDKYDANFTIRKHIPKDKDIKSSSISKGLKKSSMKKQKLYIKLFTTDTLEDELKTYKSLFEKLRKNAKISYYSKVLYKFKINSKRTWQVMKGITGK